MDILGKIQEIALQLKLTVAGVAAQLEQINPVIVKVKWSTESDEKQIAVKHEECHKRNDREERRMELFLALHLRSDHIVEHYAYRVIHQDWNNCWQTLTLMELCEGGDLEQALTRCSMTPALFKNWSKQVLLGLDYLHNHRIVHCDIKCSNVFLSSNDFHSCSLKIGDMEFATQLQNDVPSVNEVDLFGTLACISPEMLYRGLTEITDGHDQVTDGPFNSLVVGTKADIWSFGKLCIQMLNGKRPSLTDYLNKHGISTSQHVKPAFKLKRFWPNLDQETQLDLMINAGTVDFLSGCSLAVIDFILRCFTINPSVRDDAGTLLESKLFAAKADDISWQKSPSKTKFELLSRRPFTVGRLGTQIHKARRLNMIEFEGDVIAIKSVPILKCGKTLTETEEKFFKFSFKRKALKLLNLNSDHVVRYFEYSFAPHEFGFLSDVPRYFFLMEYCAGGTLSQACYNLRGSKLSPQRFQKWARQILLGVEYLHSWRIIHRDIKGDNIYLSSKDNETCVLKLGELDHVECLISDNPGAELVSAQGTPAFASVEMLKLMLGMSEEVLEFSVDKKTDIWSYGCVVLQMLTCIPPVYVTDFDGSLKSATESGETHINPKFVTHVGKGNLPVIPKDCPKEVKAVIDACLKLNPADRLDASKLLSYPFFKN